MDKKIIIFSGMPASGKDTVTDDLCKVDSSFIHFKKHKSVSKDDKIKDTYYNISANEFEKMIKNDEFLQYHGRYGRYYGIAKSVLDSYLRNNKIPIIHIGRIENFYHFINNIPTFEKKCGYSADIIHIQLWETMPVLETRIKKRDRTPDEIKKRMDAMKQEFEDNIIMMEKSEHPFDFVVRNDDLTNTCNTVIDILNGKITSANNGYDQFYEYLKSIGDLCE